MTAIAWGAVLLGGALVGALVVRAMREDTRPRRTKSLGRISDSWNGFEQQEEARRVDALRHRP